MGELQQLQKTVVVQAMEAMVVQTLGGRMQVRWDDSVQATPHGQLVFFAEFLKTAGVFEQWVQDCPLHTQSNNASPKRDVLGTLMLGILAGGQRYAHLCRVRGDEVAAHALGLQRMRSDDTVRRMLKLIPEDAGDVWMRQALMGSVQSALQKHAWVLDIDATIKPLYGHQEGAELGYNPHKPGRPSQVLHTFWVGNLRLVLDALMSPGKQHSSAHMRQALGQLLDELGDAAPALVRGDCGYGNEGTMLECESRGMPYLFRLRQTTNIKRLIARLFNRSDWTRATDASQGWQAIEDTIKLAGWTQTRRVVVLRRRIKHDVVLTSKTSGKKNAEPQQLVLAWPGDDLEQNTQLWEYTVLVTSSEFDLTAIGQLYRDRCDCENGFDELKNQWGWAGFTTQDLHRNQLTARAVALVYNWWSWYVRAANPDARREALTSRPLLLAAVGRATTHGGQTTLHLTPMHAQVGLIKSMVANVQAALQHVKQLAPQLPRPARWVALLTYICAKITRLNAFATPPPALSAGA